MQKETEDINHQRQLLLLQLEDLQTGMEILLARLETLSTTARPVGLTLTSLVQRGDGFGLVGTASSYDQVLAYAANLRDSGLFADARVLKVDGKENPGDLLSASVSFQVEATLPASEAPETSAETK
jgi:Tfp pilus assembly protein PilN